MGAVPGDLAEAELMDARSFTGAIIPGPARLKPPAARALDEIGEAPAWVQVNRAP